MNGTPSAFGKTIDEVGITIMRENRVKESVLWTAGPRHKKGRRPLRTTREGQEKSFRESIRRDYLIATGNSKSSLLGESLCSKRSIVDSVSNVFAIIFSLGHFLGQITSLFVVAIASGIVRTSQVIMENSERQAAENLAAENLAADSFRAYRDPKGIVESESDSSGVVFPDQKLRSPNQGADSADSGHLKAPTHTPSSGAEESYPRWMIEKVLDTRDKVIHKKGLLSKDDVKFNGYNITQFLEDYEELAPYYFSDNREKAVQVIRLCNSEYASVIRGIPEYETAKSTRVPGKDYWKPLKKALQEEFLEQDKDYVQSTRIFLEEFVGQQNASSFDLRQYCHDFSQYSNKALNHGQISEVDQVRLFMQGVAKPELRGKLIEMTEFEITNITNIRFRDIHKAARSLAKRLASANYFQSGHSREKRLASDVANKVSPSPAAGEYMEDDVVDKLAEEFKTLKLDKAAMMGGIRAFPQLKHLPQQPKQFARFLNAACVDGSRQPRTTFAEGTKPGDRYSGPNRFQQSTQPSERYPGPSRPPQGAQPMANGVRQTRGPCWEGCGQTDHGWAYCPNILTFVDSNWIENPASVRYRLVSKDNQEEIPLPMPGRSRAIAIRSYFQGRGLMGPKGEDIRHHAAPPIPVNYQGMDRHSSDSEEEEEEPCHIVKTRRDGKLEEYDEPLPGQLVAAATRSNTKKAQEPQPRNGKIVKPREDKNGEIRRTGQEPAILKGRRRGAYKGLEEEEEVQELPNKEGAGNQTDAEMKDEPPKRVYQRKPRIPELNLENLGYEAGSAVRWLVMYSGLSLEAIRIMYPTFETIEEYGITKEKMNQYQRSRKPAKENIRPQGVFGVMDGDRQALEDLTGEEMIRIESDLGTALEGKNPPYIPTRISNIACEGMVDTGAGVNIIHLRLATKAKLAVFSFPKAIRTPRIIAANGSPMNLVGFVRNCPVNAGGIIVPASFFVATDVPFDLCLGIIWCCRGSVGISHTPSGRIDVSIRSMDGEESCNITTSHSFNWLRGLIPMAPRDDEGYDSEN